MKRIFYLVIIITLPLIAFFQYRQYRRFHPPKDYSYPLNDSVDTNYYNPEEILKYYQAAEESGTFARYCWAEHGLDVKFSNPNTDEEKSLVRQYQQKLAWARFLEAKLVKSSRLKSQGFDNETIQKIEESGLEGAHITLKSWVKQNIRMQRGETGKHVYEAQEILAAKGFQLPVDGYYQSETEAAVSAFQDSSGIYPTGIIDDLTLERLLD